MQCSGKCLYSVLQNKSGNLDFGYRTYFAIRAKSTLLIIIVVLTTIIIRNIIYI